MNENTSKHGLMNLYELTKSNRFGYGSVFNPQYTDQSSFNGLSEPSGRWGCLIPGTRPSTGTVQETYCTIYYWSNKDANAAYPYVPLTESYEYPDVASVFNVYVNGVRNGECPEYLALRDNKNTVINKTAVDYKAAVAYVAKRVPSLKKYTSSALFVETMFYTAAEQYRQSDISIRPDIIWPKTVDSRDPGNPIMNGWYNKREEKIESAQSKDSVFKGVNDLLSNILTLAVVGTALYLLAPVVFGRK